MKIVFHPQSNRIEIHGLKNRVTMTYEQYIHLIEDMTGTIEYRAQRSRWLEQQACRAADQEVAVVGSRTDGDER